MNKPVICFPRGSGGHWLGNLIWRLENNKFDLSEVDVVFDHETVTNSFELTHRYNLLIDEKTPTFTHNLPNLNKQIISY